MSEKKTIQINPDLFKFSDKKSSRKKQPKTDAPKIQIKSSLKKQKQKTLRKNVLKMIREKQQEAYRDLFDSKKPKTTSTSSSESEFNKDFEDSLNFFSSLANKVDSEKSEKNTTFKNYENMNSVLMQPTAQIFSEPLVHVSLPETLLDTPVESTPIHIATPKNPVILPTPKYGCLKNGTLPTFRNLTQRTYGGSNDNIFVNNSIQQPSESYQPPSTYTPLSFVEKEKPIISNEIIQKFDKLHNGGMKTPEKIAKKIKYLKRKKIFKRTYHIGRSKVAPKIGVLVSNKTIRSRISTSAQLLKQTPIQDVRKFLIKKGFIKVGTNAPNDVLRKMYESVSLVCGEVQNHNPENLLYNFIHDS
jgi:hypothetical protein